MSSEPFVPDEDVIENAYVDAHLDDRRGGIPAQVSSAEFRRGIAKVRADTLREAADAISLVVIPGSDENDNLATAAAQGWLTGRANRIEEEA